MPRLKHLDFLADATGRQGIGARAGATEAASLIGDVSVTVRALPSGRIAAYRNGRLLASAEAPEDLARLCVGL